MIEYNINWFALIIAIIFFLTFPSLGNVEKEEEKESSTTIYIASLILSLGVYIIIDFVTQSI